MAHRYAQIFKYYLPPPSTAALPSYEGCAVKQFKQNTFHIQYNRKNPKRSLHCEMSMEWPRLSAVKQTSTMYQYSLLANNRSGDILLLVESSDGHTFVYSLLRYRYRYIVSNGRY
jgi:hypothetical protein